MLLPSRYYEYETVCRNPFCRIRQSVPTLPILPNFFRQSGHRNSAKWVSKFGKVGKAIVYICKNRLFESEIIMRGIFGVCTLALTFAKTSTHYDCFAISVPARSLLLFDLAYQDGIISGPKGPRVTNGNGDISETGFIL